MDEKLKKMIIIKEITRCLIEMNATSNNVYKIQINQIQYFLN